MRRASVRPLLFSTIKVVDRTASRLLLRFAGERNALIVLLFHSLFLNRDEIEQDLVAPQQGVTTAQLCDIIDYFKRIGYSFTYPEEIARGLDPGRGYVLITFDDGYFNNTRAVPILEESGVPAVFFVSTNHVIQQKPFWWDVLHRQAIARNWSSRDTIAEKKRLKKLTNEEIEVYLREAFGLSRLVPIGDTDRPLTVDELREMAHHPLVHIGNHTADHAMLTNYSLSEAKRQIHDAQVSLREITGKDPMIISYPNGNLSREIIQIARDEKLQLGITGITKKNYLPILFDGSNEMILGRMIPFGGTSISAQCRAFRSDWSLYAGVRRIARRLTSRGDNLLRV